MNMLSDFLKQSFGMKKAAGVVAFFILVLTLLFLSNPMEVKADVINVNDVVNTDYTGMAVDLETGRKFWLDNGVIARNKEAWDPARDAWYWFDADGTMAVNKDVFIPTNAERSEGKWVRYDQDGCMIKGEDFRYGGWYWFDSITGEMKKGFANIPDGTEDGKWVCYDAVSGQMYHGESCIYESWYRFDDITGELVCGEYCDSNGNWYYYDETTGVMQKGKIYHDGEWYYYDKITGILQNDIVYAFIQSLQSLKKSEEDAVKITAEASQGTADTFQITYTKDKDFKVMQVTDTHISGNPDHAEKNIKAMQTVYDMAVREQPDFIVMTGDLIFGMYGTDSEQDLDSLEKALAFMDKLGIPWTWCFGNHDHDFLDRLDVSEVKRLIQTSHTLYMPENNIAVKGYSNAVFKVYQDDKLLSAFITMDTNGSIYDSNGNFIMYDYMDETQTAWYRQKIDLLTQERGELLPTFVYLHIPLEEYAKNNTIISGELREAVCCSEIENLFVETVLQLGSTKAILCGHDHVNDAIMQYGKLLLVYAKSIDYTAYENIETQYVQRGVGRLVLYKDGEFDIKNVQYKKGD